MSNACATGGGRAPTRLALVLLTRLAGGSMNDRTEYTTWLCCFLAGGLAGASPALLRAPQSGRDTRGRMGRRLRRAARSARELRNRLVDQDPILGGDGPSQPHARGHEETAD